VKIPENSFLYILESIAGETMTFADAAKMKKIEKYRISNDET
jgi:hypothetical protein